MSKEVYISLGHATGHCIIGVSGISGTIIQETEKAVQLQSMTEKGKTVTAWFPKKALGRPELRAKGTAAEHTAYKLASWFRASGWTAEFIRLTVSHSVVSA